MARRDLSFPKKTHEKLAFLKKNSLFRIHLVTFSVEKTIVTSTNLHRYCN